MAKLKTLIIYAASANLAEVTETVGEARDRDQPVRLIALEEFRGETEQNAGAVFVQRSEGDELVVNAIQQAYPLIEVQDFGGKLNLDKPETFVAKHAKDDLAALRLELIRLGGSAPAGADAAQLGDLIASQKLALRHTPILPNPATQGTTIPDPTPIIQQADGDKLINSRATGTTQPLLEAAAEASGEAATGTQTAGASAPLATTAAAEGEVGVQPKDGKPLQTDKSGDRTEGGTAKTTATGAKPATPSKPAGK